MPSRALTLTAITAVLAVGSAASALGRASPSQRPGHDRNATIGSAARRERPDEADWQKIKAAARLRNMGMARHRTAHFRVFAGSLGLSELSTIQPLAPGSCRTALTYLYGNLLDLQNAERGENFAPLRRFVAREPSIRACAPRRSAREG
jgi:hypothetical protein